MDIEEEFTTRARNYVAPIYLFNQKIPPQENEKLTANGTVTLFRKEYKIYGITNYHLYKGEDVDNFKRRAPGNYVYQIGCNCFINLESRIRHEDANNDLIVFFLYDYELEKIGTPGNPKQAFRVIDTRLSGYLAIQDENNHETWFTHCAGYPGQDKITTRLSDREYEESFGFHLFHARATCEKDKIILDFSALKESGKIPKVDSFTEENMIFGGMSGGPVFGRTQLNSNDLSLFGIIYEGSAVNSTYEFVYAKPISILEQILI